MNPDTCPRCGLPEHWTLKVRMRVVFVSLAVALVAGLAIGAALVWMA